MLTGRQYKESLEDGRRVYFEGRLIEDFGAEPALAVPCRPSPTGTTSTTAPNPAR